MKPLQYNAFVYANNGARAMFTFEADNAPLAQAHVIHIVQHQSHHDTFTWDKEPDYIRWVNWVKQGGKRQHTYHYRPPYQLKVGRYYLATDTNIVFQCRQEDQHGAWLAKSEDKYKEVTLQTMYQNIQTLYLCLKKAMTKEQERFKQDKDAADWFNNNTPGVGQTVEYQSYSALPWWAKQAESILQMVNDNYLMETVTIN